MSRITVLLLAACIFGYVQMATDNRATFMTKIVKLGVTFYKASELQAIFKCCENQTYATPTNTTAIASVVKSCVVNNSGSKATTALVLYSNMNNCLSAETLDGLVTKLVPPAKKYAAALAKKLLNNLKSCKSNTTIPAASRQETCLQKCYGILKAAITVKYVNTFCSKIVNNNLNATEWNCALKYAPQVVNATGYSCASIKLT